MKTKMETLVDHLYPIVGGLIGSIIGFFKTGIAIGFMGMITWHQMIDVILIAAIGATVGWTLKKIYDYLALKIKEKLKR